MVQLFQVKNLTDAATIPFFIWFRQQQTQFDICHLFMALIPNTVRAAVHPSCHQTLHSLTPGRASYQSHVKVLAWASATGAKIAVYSNKILEEKKNNMAIKKRGKQKPWRQITKRHIRVLTKVDAV